MRHFTVFSCTTCGLAKAGPGMCSACEAPLAEYSKDDYEDFKLDMYEARKFMNDRVWYV